MKADTTRLLVHTSLALVVLLGGIGFALAPAAAAGPSDAGQEKTSDDAEKLLTDTGTEVCHTLFGGPHLSTACESTVHDTVDTASP